MNIETKDQSECCRFISWNAILVGGLLIIGLSFLFHLLSTGFGLSIFPRTEAGATALIMGAIVWLVVVGYLILFLAGYITGRLASPICTSAKQAALHGFLAWALALIILVGFFNTPTDNIVPPAVKSNVSQASQQYMQSPDHDDRAVVSRPVERAINKIGIATLAAFFIFFAGALGSTMGAYFSVTYHKIYPDKRKIF